MKVIIAGSRYYNFTKEDVRVLDMFHAVIKFTEVVSGGATGADRCGETWASMNGLHVKVFLADWTKYGKPAGPIRNRQMAEYADAVILFPGNKGTSSMRTEARKAGIYCWVIPTTS